MKKLSIILFIIPVLISCGNGQLSFLTYNLRLNVASDSANAWPYRKNFLVEQLKFYGPDIFGTQEGLPEQISFMDEQLSAYDYVGIGREANGGEYSALFYKKDRFNVLKKNTFWLSETPDTISMGWDAACLRICTYAHLQDKNSRKKFWVFNTHLDHMGNIARIESIKLITTRIEELTTDKEPVILMGDFNAPPESELIKLTEQQFTNTEDICETKPYGPCGTFNGFDFYTPVTQKIDYIFIKNPVLCKVKKHAVLSDSKDCRYPSDHLPVYTELSFK
jgi:endonuclease/exonuclease/phosphatase family metal-dependent hydrolase